MDNEPLIVEKIEGNLTYCVGHPYPFKGVTTQEAMNAFDIIKRFARHAIHLEGIFFTPKGFIRIADKILKPHYKTELTPFADEFRKLLTHVCTPTLAKIFAHVVEYDWAYRFRLQDLFSETTKEKLSQRPIREINRLIEINKRRENAQNRTGDRLQVHRPIKRVLRIIQIFLLNPFFRATFKRALTQSDFKRFQFDEGDKYWLQKRIDYHHDA